MGPSPKGAWVRLFYERDAPSPGHTQQEFQRTPFHSTPPRRMHAPTILNNKPTPAAFRQPADAAFAFARERHRESSIASREQHRNARGRGGIVRAATMALRDRGIARTALQERQREDSITRGRHRKRTVLRGRHREDGIARAAPQGWHCIARAAPRGHGISRATPRGWHHTGGCAKMVRRTMIAAW